MARPQYPLEALRRLRDERADAQARRLAEQVARSEAADAKLKQRKATRLAHAERTASQTRLERERLAAGSASGADLLRQAEFEAASRAEDQRLAQLEAQAATELGRERVEEGKLREELSRLEAERKLVQSHEARFHEQAARAQERAEEEAALEQWNARRR